MVAFSFQTLLFVLIKNQILAVLKSFDTVKHVSLDNQFLNQIDKFGSV